MAYVSVPCYEGFDQYAIWPASQNVSEIYLKNLNYLNHLKQLNYMLKFVSIVNELKYISH